MKSLKFALATGMVALAATTSAQTATFVKSIDISSVSNFPTGIAAVGTDLFVASFNNQDLIKITDPLGATPTVAQATDLSSAVTWGSGRGLGSVNVGSDGNLYASGDSGTANSGFWAAINPATGAIIRADNTIANRLNAVTRIDANTLVATYVLTSNVSTYDTTAAPATVGSTSANAVAPYNANFRDVAVLNGFVYYSRNGTNPDAIGRYPLTGNSVASAAGEAVWQSSSTNSVAAYGVGVWDRTTGEDYVIGIDFPQSKVVFIKASDKTVAYELTDVTNLGTSARDAAVFTSGGNDYLAVTKPGATPPTGDSVVIYQLTGFGGGTGVQNWMNY